MNSRIGLEVPTKADALPTSEVCDASEFHSAQKAVFRKPHAKLCFSPRCRGMTSPSSRAVFYQLVVANPEPIGTGLFASPFSNVAGLPCEQAS